jgi:hypothetical protein
VGADFQGGLGRGWQGGVGGWGGGGVGGSVLGGRVFFWRHGRGNRGGVRHGMKVGGHTVGHFQDAREGGLGQGWQGGAGGERPCSVGWGWGAWHQDGKERDLTNQGVLHASITRM